MRLNVYIAKSGISSRRKADALIAGGSVSLNGVIVRQPFVCVGDSDDVAVNGLSLKQKDDIYLAFHKPAGVTSTKKDRFAKKTIVDYLPKKFQCRFPVGRLDKDSSGLLILTNDGRACYGLTHPKFMVEKEYVLLLKGMLAPADCLKAKTGVIDDGDLLKAKEIKVIRKSLNSTLCRVVVCEGKKRHLRRLFQVLGFRVLELLRVRVGAVTLGKIKPGAYHIISKQLVYKNILFD